MTQFQDAYTTYNRNAVPATADLLPAWLTDELLTIQRAVKPTRSKTITFSGGRDNSPYTANVADGFLLVDNTLGAVSILLPTATRVKEFSLTIKKIDNSGNAVTITPMTSTIDGASSVSILQQYGTLTIRSNGAQYYATVRPTYPALSTIGTLTFGSHLQSGSLSSFNGSANGTIATDADSANTGGAIVSRDSSGNFTAGKISAATGFFVAGTGTIGRGGIVLDTTYGMTISAYNVGGTNDFTLFSDLGGLDYVFRVPTATHNVVFNGGNVSGITTLTATTLAGTLSTAAQPNVTSVGTLTGLNVSGGMSTTGSLSFGGGAATLYNVISVTGTTTAAAYQRMSNTGADCIFGIERSTGGVLLTGSAAYAGVITMVGNTPLQFGSNNTLALSMLGNAVTMPGTLAVTGVLTGSADIKLATVGSGYYAKEGTNATMGVATLSTGTVVVATTKVTASSRIFVSRQDDPSALGVLPCDVTARVVGTSFTIKSSNPLDNATVAWIIFEPS